MCSKCVLANRIILSSFLNVFYSPLLITNCIVLMWIEIKVWEFFSFLLDVSISLFSILYVRFIRLSRLETLFCFSLYPRVQSL
jgi:hypothetical protein